MLALIICKFDDIARTPDLMIDAEAGETLTYETGETISVAVNGGGFQTVPEIAGGWVVVSETPPDVPVDTVLLQVDGTSVMVSTLDARLKAVDARLGVVQALEV